MNKKKQLKKVSSGSSVKVQSAKYWQKRPVSDKDRDWGYGEKNWLLDYNKSVAHPHRKLILTALQTFPWGSLLEVGCSTGPNLKLIHQSYPLKNLAGIDVSVDSIKEAKKFLGNTVYTTVLDIQSVEELNATYDVVLADASLMYIPGREINEVMDALVRMANKTLIIIDRFNESQTGVSHYIWSRNYQSLMEDRGLSVELEKITKDTWPGSENWQKFGYMWIGRK